jgi:hypothetical protein
MSMSRLTQAFAKGCVGLAQIAGANLGARQSLPAPDAPSLLDVMLRVVPLGSTLERTEALIGSGGRKRGVTALAGLAPALNQPCLAARSIGRATTCRAAETHRPTPALGREPGTAP